MTWYKVKTFALDENLQPLMALLNEQGIQTHVSEQLGEQLLWSSQPLSSEQIDTMLAQLAQLQVSGIDIQLAQSRASLSRFSLARLWRGQPLTVLLIALSFVGALPALFDAGYKTLALFTFTDFRVDGTQIYLGDLSGVLVRGEYWRLITPMFIHFGALHVLFNSLWMWELGRRIERVQSWRRLLLVVLVSSLAANFLQYAFSGPSLFGGMSGVVYGVIGYMALWQRFEGRAVFNTNPALFGFMLFFLVLGFTGAMDFFIDGSVANGAHLGGLLAGVAMASILLFFQRLRKKGIKHEL